MSPNKLKVLLIEDDRIDQKAFERFILSEKYPYDYTIASSIQEAKKYLNAGDFDIVITDYQLSDGTGMEILALYRKAPVILTTGTGSEEIAVSAMRAGAYDYLIKDPDRYYLKVLGVTIEKTIKRKETEERIRMLSHAIMGIHDSVLITDDAEMIIFVNQAFCTTYGYDKYDLLGKTSGELWQQIAGGVRPDRSEGEFMHRKKNGREFPVHLSTSVLKDEGNRETATVYIMLDMTERKQAEHALLRRTEELARSKTELEQLELFAFVASHDLQEPLHKIMTYGRLLTKHLGEAMDASTRDYLGKIELSVKRMGERMERTRDYSRIVREGHPFKAVALETVIRQAMNEMKTSIEEAGARVELDGSFPIIDADEIQLRSLFENLINNGVKFRKKEKPSRVTIRLLEPDGAYVRVAVEDNGIGFDEKYLGRLFKPFESLHSINDYEGSGMGLAICQKILLRHGGKFDVKSAVGAGSTFTISLPLVQRKE